MPALTVELRPDAQPRTLRLVVYPERNCYALHAYEAGVVYVNLRLDGAQPPTFKRQSDALAWCKAHGLNAATRTRQGNHYRYNAHHLRTADAVMATPRERVQLERVLKDQ